jgi:hypothetical protein
MTVEEKREKLIEYCKRSNCEDCPLNNEHGCNFQLYTNDIIEDDYELIFGAKKNDISNDPVNRPSHYTDGKIEVIEFIEDKKLGFCLGNAIKYIARAGKKDPTKEIEDLRKAKWYVERRIKELEEV